MSPSCFSRAAASPKSLKTWKSLRRRFVRLIPGSAAACHQSQRQSADGQNRDQLLDADRPDPLDARRHQHGIGKRGLHGGFRVLFGAGFDLIFAYHVAAGRDQRDDKEYAGAGQAGFDQPISLQHEDERGSAKKRCRDEQGHSHRRRQRCQTQGRAGRVLEIIDHALKHLKASLKIMLTKNWRRLSRRCSNQRIDCAEAAIASPACGYRRHVTPIRKPRPRARPTVASGRSAMTSSSVSSIEWAASWAASMTALPRSDASSIAESTLARACL